MMRVARRYFSGKEVGREELDARLIESEVVARIIERAGRRERP